MGLNDTAEQLHACRADNVQLETALTEIRRRAEAEVRLEQPSIRAAQHWADVVEIARKALEWRP